MGDQDSYKHGFRWLPSVSHQGDHTSAADRALPSVAVVVAEGSDSDLQRPVRIPVDEMRSTSVRAVPSGQTLFWSSGAEHRGRTDDNASRLAPR
jgi:hypothetical protein